MYRPRTTQKHCSNGQGNYHLRCWGYCVNASKWLSLGDGGVLKPTLRALGARLSAAKLRAKSAKPSLSFAAKISAEDLWSCAGLSKAAGRKRRGSCVACAAGQNEPILLAYFRIQEQAERPLCQAISRDDFYLIHIMRLPGRLGPLQKRGLRSVDPKPKPRNKVQPMGSRVFLLIENRPPRFPGGPWLTALASHAQ